MVCAHTNSLRAIIQAIDGLTLEQTQVNYSDVYGFFIQFHVHSEWEFLMVYPW